MAPSQAEEIEVLSKWVAIRSTSDRRQVARDLAAAHATSLSTGRPAAEVRDVIAASWERCQDAGLDIDGPPPPVGDPDEARERWNMHPVARAIGSVRSLLHEVGAPDDQVFLFCDADGTLLWLEGAHALLRKGLRVHLDLGSKWSETAAGTNAMGTALATGHPLQVFSAEHYARAVHDWSCCAAPIRDPETGTCLGVLDFSGRVSSAHPHSLGVATTAARLIEQELRRIAHQKALRLVRSFGGRVGAGRNEPVALASPGGQLLLAARDGLVGAHVDVPADGGYVALPGIGRVLASPLPDGNGFLLWPAGPDRLLGSSELRLGLLGTTKPRLVVDGEERNLQPRQSEILALLALRPSGWTAEQLAVELFGDRGSPVTIRALISRLRPLVGNRLQSQPYRLSGPLSSDFGEVERLVGLGHLEAALDLFSAGDLLPRSEVPTIREARLRLDLTVRESVLSSADPALLARWLSLPQGNDDVQACRALMQLCPTPDPRHALAAARLRRLSAG